MKLKQQIHKSCIQLIEKSKWWKVWYDQWNNEISMTIVKNVCEIIIIFTHWFWIIVDEICVFEIWNCENTKELFYFALQKYYVVNIKFETQIFAIWKIIMLIDIISFFWLSISKIWKSSKYLFWKRRVAIFDIMIQYIVC